MNIRDRLEMSVNIDGEKPFVYFRDQTINMGKEMKRVRPAGRIGIVT